MATKFSDLYEPLRFLLGDIRPQPTYSTAQLDMAIAGALLEEENFDEGSLDGDDRTITPAISNKADKQRMVLRSAIGMLDPNSGPFAYRTRTISVTRNISSYVGNLRMKLRALESDTEPIGDTEWTRFLHGSSKAIADIGSFPG